MLEALLISQLVLWALVLALAIMVLALVRQIGVLHERITPMGALTLDRGPKEGEPAPIFELPDLLGRGAVKIGGAREGGRSLLVMFVAPGCPVCKKLLPIIRSVARSEADWLETVLASDGDLEEQRRFVKNYRLDDFPYLLSGELGMTYRIGKLPYGVLIDGAGVLRAKGLINTREHLESLMEAKQMGVASIQEYLKLREAGANGGTATSLDDKPGK
ncbi:MAG TPA: methylamine dehydrogenase accessory protein MauD [Candidatus Binataceae bacterium]|nr:methylamine dehydrogenase accessory protein MauD [Candidatus Binataceae bacterium]